MYGNLPKRRRKKIECHQRFLPKDASINEKVESGQLVETEQELLEEYGAYVGEYVHPANNDVFKVFIQDGSLTVEIPGKVVLSLSDPDEEGLWYSKLSDRLYFIFNKDNSGEITEMELHQLIPLPEILVQVYAAIFVKLYALLF